MTPGNLEFLQYLIAVTIELCGSAAVILLDQRRLTGEALERSWPNTTLAAALWYWSPFCVVIHFARTRGWKSLRGWALGVLWCLAIIGLAFGMELLAEAAADWPDV
jgi:hypothetical protein